VPPRVGLLLLLFFSLLFLSSSSSSSASSAEEEITLPFSVAASSLMCVTRALAASIAASMPFLKGKKRFFSDEIVFLD